MNVIEPSRKPDTVIDLGVNTIYYNWDNPQVFHDGLSGSDYTSSLQYVFDGGMGTGIYDYQRFVNDDWWGATLAMVGRYLPGGSDQARQNQLDFERELSYFSGGQNIPSDKPYLRYNPNPEYVNGVNTEIQYLKIGSSSIRRSLNYFYTWHLANYYATEEGADAFANNTEAADVTASGDTKYIPPFESSALYGNTPVMKPTYHTAAEVPLV